MSNPGGASISAEQLKARYVGTGASLGVVCTVCIAGTTANGGGVGLVCWDRTQRNAKPLFLILF